MKRLFDIAASAAGILMFSPLFLLVALLVKTGSPGPVFFSQERVGKDFRPFRIHKFRTMREDAEKSGPPITVAGDDRITGIGRILRRYKLDELPQLLNVLKGDMSFVGPRPEVREYIQIFRDEYERLLTVRPGITDPASIRFSNEERILAGNLNWEENYRTRILPEKIRMSLEYIEHNSVMTDLSLIVRTILRIR
jgi:lipopolysaccharide/colanic/teichoic acid biosynthesis glycosyltransferase